MNIYWVYDGKQDWIKQPRLALWSFPRLGTRVVATGHSVLQNPAVVNFVDREMKNSALAKVLLAFLRKDREVNFRGFVVSYFR